MQNSESLSTSVGSDKGTKKNPALKSVAYNPNKGKDDSAVACDNTALYRRARDAGHNDYIKSALKFSNFYIGDQWDKADLAKLNEEGRPALTLNMILSTINVIIGEQTERRMEARFKPRGHKDDATANTLNKLVKHILDANNYDEIEEAVFADGVIMDRGYIDIRMDFGENMMGEVKLTADDPIDVIPDPEAKDADPKTWNQCFISRWMTPDQIEVKYGFEKAEAVRNSVTTNGYHNIDDYDLHDQTFGTKHESNESSSTESKTVRKVRVTERQYYCLTKVQTWLDMDSGTMRDTPIHWTKEDIELLAQRMGWAVIERERRRVRQTVSADTILLWDDWSIYRSFTLLPFFPYFRRGKPAGVVRNLVDPQELLNKTSSQELHIVNTTANSGWVVPTGSLVNMDTDDLEDRGAETGLVIEYKGERPPEKIKPNQIPSGIERISQKAAQTIRDVSAVSTSMLGLSRADQSGKAQEQSNARGQIQVGVVTRNLEKARRAVAEKILELVQDFYTETRVFQLSEEGPGGDMEEEEYYINGVNEAGEIINDISRGQYSTTIGIVPSGGSEHDKQFAEIAQLREMGVEIPDHIMISYSSLHKRNELTAMLKQKNGFNPPTEEEQATLEMQEQMEIQRVTLELKDLEASIREKEANAANKMADAQSKDGYNIAALELEKLRVQQQLKQVELGGRIALAARSHQNAQLTNEKRNVSALSLKALDLAAIEQKPQPEAKKKETA